MRRLLPLVLAGALVAAAACAPTADDGERSGPASSAAASQPSPDPTSTSGSGVTPSVPLTGSTGPTAQASPETERTRFAGRVSVIPSSMAAGMRGTTWRPGCPVPISDLALLRFNYRGMHDEVKRGPLVVNASVAEDVLWVFRQLFDAGYPFKRIGLAREFHERRLEEDPHSRRNVTASFNCRVVVTPAGPGDTFSQHSYGLAIDVNPLLNPFVRSDGWVRNRFAEPYVDRTKDEPGMIHAGDVVVRSFAAIGWSWGGFWTGDKDYMHFSLADR